MDYLTEGFGIGFGPASAVTAFWLATVIVHLGFAVAVFIDSSRMLRLQQRGTFLAGGWLWALATLLGGVLVVAAYWLIHHSTLRPSPVSAN